MHFMSIRSSVRSCQNFSEPCSSRYISTEQYKYPECYDITNTANTSESSVYIPTTDLSHLFRESTSTESTSQTIPSLNDAPRMNIQGLSAGETTGIVLTAVLVVFFMCLLTAFFFYVKGEMIKENRPCRQVIAAIPFCCQCIYEGCILLKIQDFMDKRYRRVDVCDHGSQSTLAVSPDATSSVALLSNQENDENNGTTDSHETYEKQIVKNDDECDVSLQINTQQQKTTFFQNQPDTSSTTTTTDQPLEPNSDVHPPVERVIPPSTSELQSFDSSSSSHLEVSLQHNQQPEAGSSVSSQSRNKPLNYPQDQQMHRNIPKTDQLDLLFSTSDSLSHPVSQQNSLTSSTVDQQDTSYNTLQSEPLDLSMNSTPVSVSANSLENTSFALQNCATAQRTEVSPATLLSTSTIYGSGDSYTIQKQVQNVPPENPEASSELAPTGPRTKIKLGKTSTETPPNKTKHKMPTRKDGGRMAGRLKEDKTEVEVENIDVNETVCSISKETVEQSTEESTDESGKNASMNENFQEREKTLIHSISQLKISLQQTTDDLQRAMEKVEEQDALVREKDREIRLLSITLDDRDKTLDDRDRTLSDRDRALDDRDRELERKNRKIAQLEREKDKLIRERDAEQRRIRQLKHEKEALERERDKRNRETKL